jgi:hypothetical protein
MVGGLLGKTANASAPGDDRISAGILKVFWEWDQQRIARLVRACIRLGHHPELWKMAKGIVIPKAGKPDYSKVRAYRVICLLDVISKLVERTAGHLIADHLERKKGLHEGQYGCRKRRSCIDAVAVLMNRTQQAWGGKKIAGALFMDVKSAFNKVSKTHLGKRMEALELEPDSSDGRTASCLVDKSNSYSTARRGRPTRWTLGSHRGHQQRRFYSSPTCRASLMRWREQCRASRAYPLRTISHGGRKGKMRKRWRQSWQRRQLRH